ncbi:AraC family transcriptional regulator [Maribacter sp. 1_MG-2023]|uniref:AraC family transcriptional regulator n=1 Tax=Maribacter sp. 1_MG-2023 TaxID=3062677 RepID=UPI0026E3A4FF|nr:helix-turn-helix transcriptional regulator [Maribacter sp. 1_MG-2023]MDO6473281.1 helix-turn-helix transcriptional regulator [Maribacter sp. 1_MG-2023]
MKNIPNISFQGSEDSSNFECLVLNEFFERMPDIKDHDPTLPHRIDFFALLIVSNGFGTHNVDLEEYSLVKGSVLKIAKGQIHNFQKNAKYEGFLLIFTEELVMNYFSKSSICIISHLYNYHITSPISNNITLNENFLTELSKELRSENSFAKINIIATLLNLYLLRLERFSNINSEELSNSKNYSLFIKFKNLVESTYSQTRNVKDYAELLTITTKHLNEAVKDYTLNTAKSFIDNYVILETKRVIVSTDKSFKEIAFEIGFDELTNFTKFFKKKAGISPKEFRNSQL